MLFLSLVLKEGIRGSLFQNDNGSSKYNDILAQHATWHYMLNAKKFKLLNRKWQVDVFSKFIKGKHGFFNWGKTENFEIPFLARKIGKFWSRVHRQMQNRNIWGGMFPKKSLFCQYFHEIIMILDFWGYIGAPL